MKGRLINLTEEERKILNDATIGHGKLIATSELTELDTQTLRNVRRNGRGFPGTIETLRKKLFVHHKANTTS